MTASGLIELVGQGRAAPRCSNRPRVASRRWQGDGVAVLIDEPMWWYRGQRWSHLVSDTDFPELHAFAHRVGIPRRGFQGDHYDVPEEYYVAMVQAGAIPTPSRELVRRIRAAGLRLGPAARRAAMGEGEGGGDVHVR